MSTLELKKTLELALEAVEKADDEELIEIARKNGIDVIKQKMDKTILMMLKVYDLMYKIYF